MGSPGQAATRHTCDARAHLPPVSSRPVSPRPSSATSACLHWVLSSLPYFSTRPRPTRSSGPRLRMQGRCGASPGGAEAVPSGARGGARGGGAIRVPARGDGEVLLLPLLARHRRILGREVRQGQPDFVREGDGRSYASCRERRHLASRDVGADVVGWDHSHGNVQGTAILRRLSHTGLDPHTADCHQIVCWLDGCQA